MTKLVVVLAVVVVVILVVVIVAVRNMRAEDAEEFSERPSRPGRGRGSDGGRDPRYDRQGAAERHSARAVRSARPSGRQAGDTGAQRRPEGRQAPARTRAASARRSDDSSEWDSSEWEKLSDVDYWAELTSDKPLTTTAQPAAAPAAPARPGRPAEDRGAGQTGATEMLAALAPARNSAPRRDPETGLPVRSRPEPGGTGLPTGAPRTEFAAAPVPVPGGAQNLVRNGAQDPLDPLAAGARPRHIGPASLPGALHSIQQSRPQQPPDDDPLTSPSFPRIPVTDSRSYRNPPINTPAGGSRAPAQDLAPTEQFTTYGSAAPQRHAQPSIARHAAQPSAAQAPAARLDGNGTHDADRTDPYPYRPDPLQQGNPYPARAASAPAGAPAAGNPYGSYVTPESRATVPGYGDYPAMPDNGQGSYVLPALPDEAGQTATGYWHREQQAPGSVAGLSSYPGSPARVRDPRDAAARPGGYGNGYGPDNQAGYLPSGYPAGPYDPAGYTPLEHYGSDGYGGYPGHEASGR
jgi:hypothetical protein